MEPELKEPCIPCGKGAEQRATRAATCVVVVEDGSVVPGANSYTSVADADTFLACQRYNDAWLAATPDEQAQAVVTATRAIDAAMDFNGYLTDPTTPQSLRWPRVYAPNPEVYLGYPYGGYPVSMGAPGYGYWPSNVIPQCLKDATAMEALECLRLDRISDNPALGLQSVRVDTIDVVYRAGTGGGQSGGGWRPLSDQVMAILGPLGSSSTSGAGFVPVARVV
jgi:hypothetical protein